MAQIATRSQYRSIEQPANETKSAGKGMIWTGRILTILTVLFMLFDAFGKLAKFPQVLDASARLGIPPSQIVSIGILLLVSTIIYAIPRTAVLGAVLLTGYLGGAVAIQMRAGSPTFETVFPVIFGVVLWGGVYLRECGLRRVFPLKRG
jgi:hypothetical protein